jgi:hypothetical protein
MVHLVSWRTAIKGVTFLAMLVASERSSYARTPSLADCVSLPTASDLASASTEADDIHPQAGSSVIEAWRMARFVECHISHHPIAGLHSTERVCPLAFADARVFAPELQVGAEAVP